MNKRGRIRGSVAKCRSDLLKVVRIRKIRVENGGNSSPTIEINASEEEKLSIIGRIRLLRILLFAKRQTKESTAGKTPEGGFEEGGT